MLPLPHAAQAPALHVMGEGWGEGEYNAISTGYIPLPRPPRKRERCGQAFVPSSQGRGNPPLAGLEDSLLSHHHRFTTKII